MPRTVEGLRLTRLHRAQQLAVRARSLRQLITLWPVVDPEDLGGTLETFTQAAVLLALAGHDESASISEQYVSLLRRAESIRGAVAPYRAPAPPRATLAGELRGAAASGIIDARRSGMSLLRSKERGLIRTASALVKLVLTGGRMTIIGTVQRDPVAIGWQRLTDGDPCAFCRMLASRGAVYKTERTARFEPHGSCACTADPIYAEDEIDPQAAAFRGEFDMSKRWARASGTMASGTSNNALNDYRRWLANGKPDPGATSNAGNGGNDGRNPE